MLKRTALFQQHQQLGARLVDFAGWEMPIAYASQLDEHHAVRSAAGMFDVSHMCAVDLAGSGARVLLSRLLANDVAKLAVPGKALYTCLLRDDGGVIDDLICYWLGGDAFRLVVNAGTTDKDLAWIVPQAETAGVTVNPRRDLGILAVQGPQARELVHGLLPAPVVAQAQALKPFSAIQVDGLFIARTGYTGEDGYELIAPQIQIVAFWTALLARGVTPCGLGARDTLRLEAGMNLYGQDMDEQVSPLQCGLAWTLAFTPGRDFIGRAALEAERDSAHPLQVGLLLEGRGVLRAHMPLRFADGARGEITSGGFAPTLKRSVALARIGPTLATQGEVEIRGSWHPVRLCKPPFVRHGRSLIDAP